MKYHHHHLVRLYGVGVFRRISDQLATCASDQLKTGLITGIPTSMGLYNIAIKVSEYRNGVYINETLRDFTLLVVDCDIINASFPTPNWYCKGLTVDFENNSSNANTFHWDFGDNETTSSEFEPSYTYPDTGKYTVQLIANPGSNCTDTSTVTFPLYTELLPYFDNPDPQDFKDNNFNFLGEGGYSPSCCHQLGFRSKCDSETSNQINPKGVRFTGAEVASQYYSILPMGTVIKLTKEL